MADNFGYYQVLGVSQDATPEEIKQAYRQMAKKYHPDVCHQPDCTQKFRQVNEAYEFLKDKKQRTIYNTNYDNWSQFSQDDAYSNSLDQIILNLINSLNNPYSIMRNYAVEVLVRIGAPAFDAVVKASNSTDETVRRKTCDILGKMDNPQGVSNLIRLLNDPDRYVRRRAAKALIHVNDTSCVVPLMNSLNDTEKKVRYRSAAALGKIGDTRVVGPLIKSLNDPSSTVRRKAIVALGEIADHRALTPITWRLKDRSSHVRSTARHVLKYDFNYIKGPQVNPRSRINKGIDGVCPKCGSSVIVKSNFCPACGYSLKPDIQKCPKCRNPVFSNSNFCTSCGRRLKT